MRKMKLIVFAVIAVVAHATSVEKQWSDFKAQYGKTYKSLLDEKERFAIFQETLKEIEEHNERYAKGEVGYHLGITQFTDLTQKEFEARQNLQVSFPDSVEIFNGTGIVGDELINWVTKGAVTEVKNQGQCASCWAFSTAGAIEAQVKIHGGSLVNFSPQNLLDCVYSYGCNVGGYLNLAFQYVQEYGLLKESEYAAYDATQHGCRKHGGQKISSYARVKPNDEDDLLKALTSNGPVSASIDSKRMKQYTGGIIGLNSGCTEHIDHAILIVGAGSENGQKYWLVKNSWGTGWGEKGYFKLLRGQGACGIAINNWYPKF